jgi:hypothetical protein
MIRKSGNRFFEKIMFPSKNLDMILIEESQPSSFNDLDRQTAVSPHIAAKTLACRQRARQGRNTRQADERLSDRTASAQG